MKNICVAPTELFSIFWLYRRAYARRYKCFEPPSLIDNILKASERLNMYRYKCKSGVLEFKANYNKPASERRYMYNYGRKPGEEIPPTQISTVGATQKRRIYG